MPVLTPSSKRHSNLFALILVGRTTTGPLVTSVALHHWNVGLGFDCLPGSACDADDSDVAAAAILQALSCGSALGSSRSSAHVLYLRFRCYSSTYGSWTPGGWLPNFMAIFYPTKKTAAGPEVCLVRTTWFSLNRCVQVWSLPSLSHFQVWCSRFLTQSNLTSFLKFWNFSYTC